MLNHVSDNYKPLFLFGETTNNNFVAVVVLTDTSTKNKENPKAIINYSVV
jgi:hypothetical protein